MIKAKQGFIKAEQIPEIVLETLNRAHGDIVNPQALATALNAWLDSFSGNTWPDLKPTIVLPIGDTEKQNDKT